MASVPNSKKNRNKEAAGQPPPVRFSKEWYRSHSQRDRSLFEGILIVLVPFLFLFIYTLTKTPNEDGYFKIHSALFVVCVFVFLLLIIRRGDVREMLKNNWKALVEFHSVGLTELTDIAFMGSVFLAVVSVLFVIDLSFFSNYGIRIGAVAAVGLFSVLKNVFKSFKK